MNKETKKKVAGAAGAAATVAGAAAVAAAVMNNDNGEVLAEAADLAEPEPILDGEELPELEVVGEAPTLDGGSIPEVNVTGHAPIAEPEGEAQIANVAEPIQAEHISTAEPIHAETAHVVEATVHQEPVHESVAAPVEEVAEEDFEEDVDNPSQYHASVDTKETDGSILDDVLDKAEEIVGHITGHENEMNDFVNDADVSMF